MKPLRPEVEQRLALLLRDRDDAAKHFESWIDRLFRYFIPKTSGMSRFPIVGTAVKGHTCTAFSWTLFGFSGLLRGPNSRLIGLLSEQGISPENELEAIRDRLEYLMTPEQGELISEPSELKRGNSRTRLYYISLSLAGYAALVNPQKVIPGKLPIAVARAISLLRQELTDGHGGIRRLEDAAVEKSGYITFWSVLALESLRPYLNESDGNDLDKIFINVRMVALGEITLQIARHHSRSQLHFDPVECIFWTAAALLLSQEHEDLSIVRHASKIIFSEHFSSGILLRTAPVLVTADGTHLMCPTVEAVVCLWLSVWSKRGAGHNNQKDLIIQDNWESIKSIWEWAKMHASSVGWASEFEGVAGRKNLFVTASVISFAYLLSVTADDFAGMLSSEEFGAESISPRQLPTQIDIPVECDARSNIYKNIINPIVNRNRALAHYSLLLFGPPGSAKTTTAKVIARELGWRFLQVLPSDFLSKGAGSIYSETDRIFKALECLRDTVVLFDEIEELFQSRDVHKGSNKNAGHIADKSSRLLTTSMLPKIHDLRDQRRIVFIFATNHLESFDEAAIRRGRIDMIQLIPLPNGPEIKNCIKRAGIKFNLAESIYLMLGDAAASKSNMGFKDLEALVRRVSFDISKIDSSNPISISKFINDVVDETSKGLINIDDIDAYYKQYREHGRV